MYHTRYTRYVEIFWNNSNLIGEVKMALNQNKSINVNPVGLVDMTVYITVEHVSGTKLEAACNVRSRKDTKDGSIVSDDVFKFTPDMNGSNFIQQSYEHLKTLPEFAGATDV